MYLSRPILLLLLWIIQACNTSSEGISNQNSDNKESLISSNFEISTNVGKIPPNKLIFRKFTASDSLFFTTDFDSLFQRILHPKNDYVKRLQYFFDTTENFETPEITNGISTGFYTYSDALCTLTIYNPLDETRNSFLSIFNINQLEIDSLINAEKIRDSLHTIYGTLSISN